MFDGTKQGLALALLCALGAPLCELSLMGGLHLWWGGRAGRQQDNDVKCNCEVLAACMLQHPML